MKKGKKEQIISTVIEKNKTNYKTSFRCFFSLLQNELKDLMFFMSLGIFCHSKRPACVIMFKDSSGRMLSYLKRGRDGSSRFLKDIIRIAFFMLTFIVSSRL